MQLRISKEPLIKREQIFVHMKECFILSSQDQICVFLTLQTKKKVEFENRIVRHDDQDPPPSVSMAEGDVGWLHSLFTQLSIFLKPDLGTNFYTLIDVEEYLSYENIYYV